MKDNLAPDLDLLCYTVVSTLYVKGEIYLGPQLHCLLGNLFHQTTSFFGGSRTVVLQYTVYAGVYGFFFCEGPHLEVGGKWRAVSLVIWSKRIEAAHNRG
jgi:hypothetical protein